MGTRRTPLIAACVVCLLLIIYVGSYFAVVTPFLPPVPHAFKGPEGLTIVVTGGYASLSIDGSSPPPPKSFTLPHKAVYNSVLSRLHISEHVYDPLLKLDRGLNQKRWFTTVKVVLGPNAHQIGTDVHHGTNL